MYTNTRLIEADVGLQNLRAYKTWILSHSWATA